MGGPLEGIKVFEVTQIVAGPYCGMNLADLGADVIKVEPPSGEGMRLIGSFMPGEGKGFHSLNRGKRSLVMDLQHPDAQALVHRIIPDYDVFVINSRAGVPERLRVDYETLSAIKPDLIYMENTGYGDEGPSAKRSGSDIVAQAYSGLMAGEGKVDDFGAPKSISSTAIADFATGVAAAMGICAALFRRSISGTGEHIKTSLLQTALSLQGSSVGRLPVADEMMQRPMLEAVERLEAAGAPYEEIVRTREQMGRGISRAFRNYYSGYRVQDGGIILGALTPANQQQMREVLEITDDPLLDPEFNAADPAWDERVEALSEYIRQKMLTRTMDEWVEAFDATGAPVAKVNLPERMADDPQVVAMGYMLNLEHPLTGPELMPGPLTRNRNFPTGSPLTSPPLGWHTDEVLGESGVAADEIAALREAGAIA